MVWTVVEYMAMLLGVAGAYLVAKKNKHGFTAWMFANLLWICFGLEKAHYGMAAQMAIFFALAVYGYVKWSNPEK